MFKIKDKLYELKEYYKMLRDFQAYRNQEYDKIVRINQSLANRTKLLDERSQQLKNEQELLQKEAEKFVITREKYDPIQLQRHNLAGDVIDVELPDIHEDEGFYAEANSLSKNKTLQQIIQSLQRTFLENIAYRVDTEPQIKWNRARSDGLDILATTLERFGAEKEQYDGGRKKGNGRPESQSGGTDKDSSR